mgnify:CR=1 FL=1
MPSAYEPSGKFDSSVFLFFLLALAVSVGFGWLYQWLIAIIPLIILNLAVTAAYAAALWFAISLMVEYGQCRNRTLAAVMGLVIGAVGLGASHYFDYLAGIATIMEDPNIPARMRDAVEAKIGFSDWINMRVEQGYVITRMTSSSDGGPPISGVFVYGVWAIEAVIIVGAAAWGGFESAGAAFCESCGKWATDVGAFLYPNPTDEVVESIDNAGSLETVAEPEIAFGHDPDRSLRYDVEECPECDDSKYLSVIEQTITVNKDGNEELAEEPLWSKLEIGPATLETVSTIHERVAAAAENLEQEYTPERGPDPGDDAEEMAFADTPAGGEPAGDEMAFADTPAADGGGAPDDDDDEASPEDIEW